MTVRDVLGRQTTQTFSLFANADMLAPGLSEFSFEAGFLRKGYGAQSFGYGAPLVSATYRRGLDGWLTVEAHGEAAHGGADLGRRLRARPRAVRPRSAPTSRGSSYDGREAALGARRAETDAGTASPSSASTARHRRAMPI